MRHLLNNPRRMFRTATASTDNSFWEREVAEGKHPDIMASWERVSTIRKVTANGE